MSSGIEFEEDGFAKNYSQAKSSLSANSYGSNYSSEETKGMTGWLIGHGLAKSPKDAQMYLVGLVIVNLIITFVAISYLL